MRYRLVIAICTTVLILISCSDLTDEQSAVEVVKTIVASEHQLFALEIDYLSYKEVTDSFFSKYVSYIDDETLILSYTDNEGQLISYKAPDINELEDDEKDILKDKLEDMKKDFLGETALSISSSISVDDDIFVVVETRNLFNDSEYTSYSWFKLRNDENGVLKVYAIQKLLPLEEVKSILGVDTIEFEKIDLSSN